MALPPSSDQALDTMTISTALRTDGGIIAIRHATTDDHDGLRLLDAQASQQSIHFRFFSSSRGTAERYTDEISALPQSPTRATWVALIGDELIALATLEITGDGAGEIAVLVSETAQHEGVGTLLVEQLVSAARDRGLHRLAADVLADNISMSAVLHDLGLPMTRAYADGVVHIDIDLESRADFEDAVTAREQRAETASLRSLLAPASIAMIGVGRRENSVGRAVLRNLIDGGFTGVLHVVHPRNDSILGKTTVPTIAGLPLAVDLAIVAVPASEVRGVVAECGRRGVRTVLLLTAGFGETGAAGAAAQRAVLADAREQGMRLVGPNCLGAVNTDPTVRLNATFAPMPMQRGGLALASQSGAVGIAIVHAAAARGLGLAQFVSIGNKADVSSNDLLLAWGAADDVSVIGLYLESVGNPRKFVRIARSVTRTKPVIALKAGRGAVGQRAGQSHTAAAAAAEPVVEALFAQAGVQRVDTMEQLLDAVRVIDSQPRPSGRRIAIVGNAGGPAILAADVAEAEGLDVVTLSDGLRAQIRTAAPNVAADGNPVDLGAAVQPAQVAATLDAIICSGEIDALVTVFVETLAASPQDIRAAVARAASYSDVPVVASEVGAAAQTVPLPDTDRALPVFGFPEPAITALACAVNAAAVQDRLVIPAPTLPRLPAAAIHELLQRLLDRGERWLEVAEACTLLRLCGVQVTDYDIVDDPDAACAAARRLGYPVVVKVAHGVHKSDTGGVIVDVRDDAGVRAAFATLGGAEVVLQPMHVGGTELIVGAVQDPQFGPIVMTGLGGVLTELSAAHSLRLAPLGDSDIEAMISTSAMRRLVDGFRDKPPISRTALADLMRRISWLIDRCPQVAELDLNPVICRGDELIAVDVKVRIAAAPDASDPASRLLSAPRGN